MSGEGRTAVDENIEFLPGLAPDLLNWTEDRFETSLDNIIFFMQNSTKIR